MKTLFSTVRDTSSALQSYATRIESIIGQHLKVYDGVDTVDALQFLEFLRDTMLSLTSATRQLNAAVSAALEPTFNDLMNQISQLHTLIESWHEKESVEVLESDQQMAPVDTIGN